MDEHTVGAGEQTGEPDVPGLDLAVLGVPIRVTTRWAQTRAALAEQWSRCVAPPAADPLVVPAGDLKQFQETAGYGLASTITLRGIEQGIGTRLMFHAAGLASDRGEVIALVAESGTGKTTAALTLCREAFGYVTDETVSVAVDGDLEVLAYPKPLSVVRDAGHPDGKSQHGPDELGLRPAPGPLRLCRLVQLERSADAGTAALAPVGLLDGVVAASQQVSALSRLADPLQLMCRTAEDCGGFYRLSYADIAATADLLTGLVTDPPAREAEAWQPWPAEHRPEHWTDAVVVGEEALVLLDTVPVRLGPVGRTALDVLLAGGGEAEVLAATIERYGPHPDAARLVADAIAAIAASDLLPPTTTVPLAEPEVGVGQVL